MKEHTLAYLNFEPADCNNDLVLGSRQNSFFATIVVTSTVRIVGLVAEYPFTLKWKRAL
jgi:hypothetical protein